VLGETAEDAKGVAELSATLFDAVLCGLVATADKLLAYIAGQLGASASSGGADLGEHGRLLAVVLGLWRHDRIYEVARSASLEAVLGAAAERVLWLAEANSGQAAPAAAASAPSAAASDADHVHAFAALRDAVLHAEAVLTVDREQVSAAARRLCAKGDAPPELRGAALGLRWSLGAPVDARHAVPPGLGTDRIGDWLYGVFSLAREQATSPAMMEVLDGLVTQMAELEFLGALPALRMAFSYFPPREKEAVARRLLERRGPTASGRSLVRAKVATPQEYRRARGLETHVFATLLGTGLLSAPAEAALWEVKA
jgi:hypothetical protein